MKLNAKSAAVATLVTAIFALAAMWTPGVRVVDGDTVDHGFWRYRLAGFDAPEISRARCAEERALGRKARVRLREIVAGGDARLVAVKGRRDSWGRILARLEVGAADVGQALIAEGLARGYDGGERPDWCAAR